LLLKLRTSSCRWELSSTFRRCLSSSLVCSLFASYSVSQLLLLQATAPLNRVLAVSVDMRHQLHAVVCPSMVVSKRSYLRCKTDQICHHPTGHHLSSGRRRYWFSLSP
jgi:hypothetical protein